MDKVGVYEAKTHLPKLLSRVAKGQRITITKHGTAVAMLVPAATARAQPVDEVIAALRAFRRRHRLAGMSLRAMIRQGRR